MIRVKQTAPGVHQIVCIDRENPTRADQVTRALQEILVITGQIQYRPYTALSQIDEIARQALR